MGYGDTSVGGSGGQTQSSPGPARRNGGARKPVLEKTKSVSYNATTSDQIFAISSEVSATSKEAMPNRVEVQNSGGVPLMVMA